MCLVTYQQNISMRMDIKTTNSNRLKTNNFKSFIKSVGRTAILFAKHTTFHGFDHIIEDIEKLSVSNINRKQKILRSISLIIWIISCVLGGIFTVYLMSLVWISFQTTPTITTVETNNFPISNIQFPAVTLCSLNKVYAPATKNLTNKL